MKDEIYYSQTIAETMRFGMEFAKKLDAGSIVCFFGELGSGKTTFIKGVIQGLAHIDHQEISSPTFSFMNMYQENEKQVCHFDLYRMKDAEEFINSGFDDYFHGQAISLIEWSEKIVSYLPDEAIKIYIENEDNERRKIHIKFPAIG